MNVKIQKHEDTGWIDLTIICRYRAINGIVYIQIYDDGRLQLKKGNNFIGNIPFKYAPSKECNISIQLMGVGSDLNVNIHSRVSVSGDIYVHLPIESKYLEGFVSYPLG